MTAVVRTRPGDVAGAAAQTAAGVAAHVAAAGCLPGRTALTLAVPTAVVAVLLVGRLLPGRLVLGLLVGQLAVHGVLAVVAACTGGHGHTASVMAYAHVGALVGLRAVLDRVVRSAETAAEVVGRLLRPYVRRVVLRLPPAVRPAAAVVPPLRARAAHPTTPRRGPPARRVCRCVRLPA